MNPHRLLPLFRRTALALLVVLAASACEVVRFNYGDVDPIPPWDADSYVQSEFGSGYRVQDGFVRDSAGRNVICGNLGEGMWEAAGKTFSSDGPLWCGEV
jgi:hypothetical protein